MYESKINILRYSPYLDTYTYKRIVHFQMFQINVGHRNMRFCILNTINLISLFDRLIHFYVTSSKYIRYELQMNLHR